jgi:diguanylate cyclase (GGDEF)-like protein
LTRSNAAAWGTALITAADRRSWLRALNQGSTYLGLAMIALVWLGLEFHLKAELATVQEDAVQNAGNLSRAFEEHLVRTLKDADHTLQIVRNAYEKRPDRFDLAAWSKEEHALEGPTFQIVIIGPDGFMKATTEGPQRSPINLSDREHFRVHIDATDDNLFISKPLIGRVTGKPSIQLSRRITNSDGSFGGVILISLDPGHFTRFYESINIGRDGAIKVVGTDGIVRAVGSRTGSESKYLGANLDGSTLLTRSKAGHAGWYFSGSNRDDGIRRLVVYRAVEGFPLIVTVGLGEKETFGAVTDKEHRYRLAAEFVTFLVSIVMALSLRDRMRLERTGKLLQLQARQDALTGLPNRLLFLERLEEAAARAETFGEAFTVLMLDLDQFKAINDTLGHGTGDVLLRTVAIRLRSCAGPTDTVARLGGDEFAILQACKMDQSVGAIALASDAIDQLSRPYNLDGQEVIIGTSIGIATAPEHGTTSEKLLGKADLALYQSKLAGRNGYCFFETSMESRARQRRAMEADLRHALRRNEFELHYQPVIKIATHSCSGMEALLRWRRSADEIVSPAEFIPIAEDAGLISSIGEWVLRTACRDAMAWPQHIALAVNLSPAQFGNHDLRNMVLGALTDSGLPPHRLELEITETVLLERSEKNLAILASLKELGVKIVLDDFGTGYSSLSYLSMFAFDKVKIDRSFVSQMSVRRDCAAIVCSIVNLGQKLDMTTVAEGVETDVQLNMLRLAGCSEAQGYLFSRPRPTNEIDLRQEFDLAS